MMILLIQGQTEADGRSKEIWLSRLDTISLASWHVILLVGTPFPQWHSSSFRYLTFRNTPVNEIAVYISTVPAKSHANLQIQLNG
jgi:hypothetical protein